VRSSMGSVGDCYDNAICENFFAVLGWELLERTRFRTQAEARSAVFEFSKGCYNPPRDTRPSSMSHRSAMKGGSSR